MDAPGSGLARIRGHRTFETRRGPQGAERRAGPTSLSTGYGGARGERPTPASDLIRSGNALDVEAPPPATSPAPCRTGGGAGPEPGVALRRSQHQGADPFRARQHPFWPRLNPVMAGGNRLNCRSNERPIIPRFGRSRRAIYSLAGSPVCRRRAGTRHVDWWSRFKLIRT